MNYGLQTTVEIDGRDFEIRTDFRAVLEIIGAMNDPDLTEAERAACAVQMFYPNWNEIQDFEAALRECFLFVDGGEKDGAAKKPSPRVIDWETDYEYIIAAVNRVLGYEARAVPYDAETNAGGVHWWTFLAAYMEIGPDCVMSQIVNIRGKLARGKKLEKHEREWYAKNRDIVDIKTKITEGDIEFFKKWT